MTQIIQCLFDPFIQWINLLSIILAKNQWNTTAQSTMTRAGKEKDEQKDLKARMKYF